MTNLETKVIQHDEQIKTLFNKTSKLENITSELTKLAMSVEKIAINQSAMLEQQNDLKKDVDEIKLQPAKDAHDTKQKVINAVITTAAGLIVGALFTLIAIAIVKGGL